MKAKSMRKPILLEPQEEGDTTKVAMSGHDVTTLLRKQEEVERYLGDIKRATAAIERILATEKGKSTYEIRHVADIEDYYM